MTVAASALLGLLFLSPYAPSTGGRTPVQYDVRLGTVAVVGPAADDAPAPDQPADGAGDAPDDAPADGSDAPADGQPEDGEPKDGEPKDGEPKDGEPKDGEPKDGEPKDGEPKDGEPKDGEPKDGEPKDGEPKDGEPKDGEPKDGEPGEVTLDDIFGTAETHTDVTVISDSPEGDGEGKPDGSKPSTSSVARPRITSRIKDDLETRVRIVSSVYYDTARVEQRGFGRNENRLEFYFAYTPNDHLQIVGDVEPVFFGVAQTQALGDLATRQMLTPFHIESDAAYVALNDVLPNLDIKVGRQTVVWGTADKFNPTNNINPDDLEDRPLFTEPIANQMVVVDYAPLADKLWFQGVYVPIFYPALLPPSAAAALKDPQTEVPFALEGDQQKIGELQRLLDITPMLVPEVIDRVKTPRPRFANGQSAIKLGTSLGGVDMSLSYYNGRHDIPTPVLAESTTKDFEPGADAAECCFESRITMIYPRMQVIGFDFTTQLSFLRNMGLWGESALFIPQAQDLRIEFPIKRRRHAGGRRREPGG